MGIDNAAFPFNSGVCFFAAAIMYALYSYYVHLSRLMLVRSGKPIRISSSIIWIGHLTLLSVAAMLLEVVFMIQHPINYRTKEVTITAT